ncbi:MAG: HD domain-containing protein [Chryseolinea sp.]
MKSLSAVEDYVRNLLLTNLGSNYTFHNLFHTTQVVEKAMELASEEKMGSIEVEVLLFAAWFHDTGYICGSRNHEETSCAIAAEFLSRLKAD